VFRSGETSLCVPTSQDALCLFKPLYLDIPRQGCAKSRTDKSWRATADENGHYSFAAVL
jgi:hypothetical protein